VTTPTSFYSSKLNNSLRGAGFVDTETKRTRRGTKCIVGVLSERKDVIGDFYVKGIYLLGAYVSKR
jgi:hypothetical protein